MCLDGPKSISKPLHSNVMQRITAKRCPEAQRSEQDRERELRKNLRRAARCGAKKIYKRLKRKRQKKSKTKRETNPKPDTMNRQL